MTVKEQVKQLWKMCFDDTDAFIELYFEHKYTYQASRILRSGDVIVAALQTLPYKMTFLGRTLPVAYISGACTHPDYRRRGVMAELMNQTFSHLAKRRTPIATLIPASPDLLDYYRRFGFVPVFGSSVREYTRDMLPPPENYGVGYTVDADEAVYAYFARKMGERPCCIQHSEDDLRVVLKDLFFMGGNMAVAYEDEQIVGLAFVAPDGNRVIVKDVLADADVVADTLIYRSMERYGKSRVRVSRPVDDTDEDIAITGMARFMHLPTLLSEYAAASPKLEKYLYITDPQLSSNTAYYEISYGRCKVVHEPNPCIEYVAMTIAELTERILKHREPYLSLMLN
jgi:GNAT superfamily N-acetyltransferase